MLRLETETGWWLITHPAHARLAGAVGEAWGNEQFRKPEPRKNVLLGISTHDDGWALRDAHPQITRQGKPSAFSSELVGKYSAFEEIDLEDYLAVRDRAVRIIAEQDAYAGILISMHTYNLLTERADRSTIRQDHLPLLDDFLVQQREYQQELIEKIHLDPAFTTEEKSSDRIQEHFRLLQATDNMSLLTCVDFSGSATLLHPLPLNNGDTTEVKVKRIGERHFQLDPYPYTEESLTFTFPACHVEGKTFPNATALESAFFAAESSILTVTISS